MGYVGGRIVFENELEEDVAVKGDLGYESFLEMSLDTDMMSVIGVRVPDRAGWPCSWIEYLKAQDWLLEMRLEYCAGRPKHFSTMENVSFLNDIDT